QLYRAAAHPGTGDQVARGRAHVQVLIGAGDDLVGRAGAVAEGGDRNGGAAGRRDGELGAGDERVRVDAHRLARRHAAQRVPRGRGADVVDEHPDPGVIARGALQRVQPVRAVDRHHVWVALTVVARISRGAVAGVLLQGLTLGRPGQAVVRRTG